MSTCLVARTAVIALRTRGKPPRIVTVVFPARWEKSALLAYVRGEHPHETVRIVEWRPTTHGGKSRWEPALYLANPEGFANYATGGRAA